MEHVEHNTGLTQLNTRVIEYNVATSLDMERGSAVNKVCTVILVGVDDLKMRTQLDGQCDEANRQMLDRLYELAHVDRAAARTEYLGRPLSDEYFAKMVTYPTDNGFSFEEVSSTHLETDGTCRQSFKVLCRSNDLPTPQEQAPLLPLATS